MGRIEHGPAQEIRWMDDRAELTGDADAEGILFTNEGIGSMARSVF